MTLYKCWDSSIIEEEDSFEQDFEMRLEGQLDHEGAASLGANSFAAFGLPADELANPDAMVLKPEQQKKAPKPKETKTEEQTAQQKLKARLRQAGDWVMEAKGWPEQLKESPMGEAVIQDTVNKFNKWATEFESMVNDGQQLALRKANAAEIMGFLESTQAKREAFMDFLSVAKKFSKSLPKAKSKAEPKKKVKR